MTMNVNPMGFLPKAGNYFKRNTRALVAAAGILVGTVIAAPKISEGIEEYKYSHNAMEELKARGINVSRREAPKVLSDIEFEEWKNDENTLLEIQNRCEKMNQELLDFHNSLIAEGKIDASAEPYLLKMPASMDELSDIDLKFEYIAHLNGQILEKLGEFVEE